MELLQGTFRSYFGAVCVPILDKGDGTISNVTHDWANSVAGLGAGLAVTIMRLQIRNRVVDKAKERLAEMALANNCQWALFVDDDVIPPGNALLKMIKLWRSDPKYKIISGVYWSKSNPPVPLIFKGNLEGSYWDWTSQDLIKADGAGAGFLFVDTEVFKKMPKPWFSADYFFEDPRSMYDVQKWQLTDQLGIEMMKGKDADEERIKQMRKQFEELSEKIAKAQAGEFDPNLLKNCKSAAGTTEDLFFFKKAKEYGYDLWVDCTIQCQHQDKRTGTIFGLNLDMPQANPRYQGKMKEGSAVVLDIGCGDSQYFIPEGKPIRVDINPDVKPDVLADARALPFDDCFADLVYSSHLLEHFSYKELVVILREWIRVLKIGGKLAIVVPNLKYAAERIMNDAEAAVDAKRAMEILYSGQLGDIKSSREADIHRSGFTPKSMRGLLGKIDCLEKIEICTSEANYGAYDDPQWLNKGEEGYNIIATAIKKKHLAPISLCLPIKMQEKAKEYVGEKAKEVEIARKPARKLTKKTKTKEKPRKKNADKV